MYGDIKQSEVFHNNTIQAFNEITFGGLLDEPHIATRKRAIRVGDKKHYGYFFIKDKQTYFVEDLPDPKSLLDVLPIEVLEKREVDYNREVFYFVSRYRSVKIPSEKKISYKQLIDTWLGFEHTSPDEWRHMKIISTASWCSRINTRIIANKAFGKDSIIFGLNDLVGSVANIYGATFAKLEYRLLNKYLVFNEMGNMKPDDKFNMQNFLLAIGAFFNTYDKRSRATNDTLERYDISKQSLTVIHNPPTYYLEKGQEFFDTMFTDAVIDRFIPFYFNGNIVEDFSEEFDAYKTAEKYSHIYKDIISTLRYYQNTKIFNKFGLPPECKFDKKTFRFKRSFYRLAAFYSEYAEDDEELYREMITDLYHKYKHYWEVLKDALDMYGIEHKLNERT